MVRIASFNVENLFARPKAFDTTNVAANAPILAAHEEVKEVNRLMGNAVYSPQDKQRITDLLVQLDIYFVNAHGAVRRRDSRSSMGVASQERRRLRSSAAGRASSCEITATGRGSWIGWVELAKEVRTKRAPARPRR